MTQGLDARSGPGSSPVAQGTSTRGTPTRRRGQTTTGDRVFGVIAHTVLTIWALLVVLPLIWTFYSSFKNSREILTSPFGDRKSTRLNSSHVAISYAVFCLIKINLVHILV